MNARVIIEGRDAPAKRYPEDSRVIIAGRDTTAPQTNRKLKSGTPRGLPSGRVTKKYPDEIRRFILDNHVGVGPKDMAALINASFGTCYTAGQLRSYYGNHKISSGLDGRFPKGHVPMNKGKKGYCPPGCEKSWFSPGNIPWNHRPVGSERMDSKDGYILVKVAEPNVWKPKHKVVWEENNGLVPRGYVVTFLDGDKLNVSLDNLALITMAESLMLTRSKLRTCDGELTKSGILVAKVKIARHTLMKREKV